MAASDRDFPLGAAVAGSGFVIRQRLHGEPARGLYRATDASGRRALATVGTRQLRPYADLRDELAFPFAGVARLLDVGPVDGGRGDHDALLEDEPPGDPVSSLASPLGVSPGIDLALGVAEILAGPHTEELALVYLRPELVYVEHGLSLTLQVTGIAPRGEWFLESAEPPSFGVPMMWRELYLAPEAAAGGERSPACDVFSLATMLAEWVTGEHPFAVPGAGAGASLAAMAAGRRRPWSGPARLGAILDQALAPKPTRRPSLARLASELREALPN